MALHRNVSDQPLDGFPGGRQVFAQAEVDLSTADLALDEVSIHVEQGSLVAVTLATVPAVAATVQLDKP